MTADARARPAGDAVLSTTYAKLKPTNGMSADAVAHHQRDRIRAAMVELVAERGYEAVSVSEVARRAHVSTRTFYERCRSKQECLLDTHDWIIDGVAQRLDAVLIDGDSGADPIRAVLEAVVGLVARHPAEARFVYVDSCAAGLGVLERNRRAVDCFAALLGDLLRRRPDRDPLPPPLVRGIVAGLFHVVRSFLIAGPGADLRAELPGLHAWILALDAPEAAELREVEVPRDADQEVRAVFDLHSTLAQGADPATRERAQILAATLSLAAETGYWRLSVPRIRASAGVSRRCFDAHFSGVADCYAAALGLLAERVTDFVATTAADGPRWADGFHRAVTALCAYTARDPAAARLGLVEVLAAGPRGIAELTHLVGGTADRLETGAPSGAKPGHAAAGASMGAIWGLVHRCVAERRPETLPALAPYLSYLALAPAVGSATALDAIRAAPANPVHTGRA